MNPVGLVFVVTGAIVLIGAGRNMRWYMNMSKVRRSRRLFGDTGARIGHSLVGSVFLVMGLLVLFGTMKLGQ